MDAAYKHKIKSLLESNLLHDTGLMKIHPLDSSNHSLLQAGVSVTLSWFHV